MSDLSERATCSLLLADYANLSEGGKLNILGGTVSGVGYDLNTQMTNRFTLVAMIHAPGDLLPVDASVEVALYKGGELVLLPGDPGPAPLRLGQPMSFEHAAAQFQGRDTKKHVGNRQILIVDLSNGIPLEPGNYEWVLRIDGDTDNQLTEPFTVLRGTPAAPVIG